MEEIVLWEGIGGVIEEGWKRENEVVGLAEFGLTLLLPQIISQQ